jgi:hypothetical protein
MDPNVGCNNVVVDPNKTGSVYFTISWVELKGFARLFALEFENRSWDWERYYRPSWPVLNSEHNPGRLRHELLESFVHRYFLSMDYSEITKITNQVEFKAECDMEIEDAMQEYDDERTSSSC